MAVAVKRPSLWTRVRGVFARPAVVSELIGRYAVSTAQFFMSRFNAALKTVDETIPDYEYWDRLRRGKLSGYTLGGLFSDRIERVLAAWVLGDGVEVALREDEGDAEDDEDAQKIDDARRDYTNAELKHFINSLLDSGQSDENEGNEDLDDVNNSLLLTVMRDSMGLGDQYIFVNPDGTLSVPSPETVTVTRNARDYRRVEKVVITTRTTDGEVITDEYRADGRTITIKRGNEEVEVLNFANLIGRIPMVHVAFGRSRNETNGHSIHEALRPLYDQYDDVLFKQIDGAKLLGNPIPTFEGMEKISEVINANAPVVVDSYTDSEGNEVDRPQVTIDQNAVIFVGKGGRFHFAAPPTGFTKDTQQVLKTLFLLLLDRTGIPEFIWGNELSSARASSDTQMVQFTKDIQGWRRDQGGWIVKLCKIWLQVRALTDPMIVVGPLTANWPALLDEDQELRLKRIEAAKKEGTLTNKTFLKLLDLVKNPEQEAEEAEAEAKKRQDEMFPDGSTPAFNKNLKDGQNDTQDDQDEEEDEDE
ncbi:MAG: phage portal protein [Caldilineaceae bacterium]|nr:phage portal protein [Caldilineaceae bacterium]